MVRAERYSHNCIRILSRHLLRCRVCTLYIFAYRKAQDMLNARIILFRQNPKGDLAMPAGWPDEVMLAGVDHNGVTSYRVFHANESDEAVLERFCQDLGIPADQASLEPRSADALDAAQIHIWENDGLAETAEEFLMNYEFMISEGILPLAKRPLAAEVSDPAFVTQIEFPQAQDRVAGPAHGRNPEQPSRTEPDFIPLLSEVRAVVWEDAVLVVAQDGSGVLSYPQGLGTHAVVPELVSQSADGATIRVELEALLEFSAMPRELSLPQGSFIFRDDPYQITARGSKFYFHRHPRPGPIESAPYAQPGSTPRSTRMLNALSVVSIVTALGLLGHIWLSPHQAGVPDIRSVSERSLDTLGERLFSDPPP